MHCIEIQTPHRVHTQNITLKYYRNHWVLNKDLTVPDSSLPEIKWGGGGLRQASLHEKEHVFWLNIEFKT